MLTSKRCELSNDEAAQVLQALFAIDEGEIPDYTPGLRDEASTSWSQVVRNEASGTWTQVFVIDLDIGLSLTFQMNEDSYHLDFLTCVRRTT